MFQAERAGKALVRTLFSRALIVVSVLLWVLSPGITEATGLPNAWVARALMPFASVQLAAATGPDGLIYAMGGYNNGYLHTMAAYDPFANAWQTMAPMPTARQWLTAATGTDGKIYVFGGGNDDQTGFIHNIVEAYDPSMNTWSCSTGDASSGCASTAIAPMPTAREGAAAVAASNGRVYVIGGSSNTQSLSSVEVYISGSPGSGWTTAASLPAPRYDLGAATGADGRIYAIGGSNVAGEEAYSPSANSWTAVTPMPTINSGLAAAAGSDGKIYALGGFNAVDLTFAYTPVQESGLMGVGQAGVIGLQSGKALPRPGVQAGVYGSGTYGVYGSGTYGVYGSGTYGGFFGGSTSQLHLIPGKTSGHPTSGSFRLGDIYMGSTGALYVCVVAGSPCGQWDQLSETAVAAAQAASLQRSGTTQSMGRPGTK